MYYERRTPLRSCGTCRWRPSRWRGGLARGRQVERLRSERASRPPRSRRPTALGDVPLLIDRYLQSYRLL